MNALEKEIFATNIKQKTSASIPIVATALGYLAGEQTKKFVLTHNSGVEELETGVQALVADYRVQEAEVEHIIESLPGLDLWMKGYEKLFGETQHALGVSKGEFTKVNPEDISLEFMKAPLIDYPLLGAAIGLTIGLYKTANKLRQYSKEKKILRWINEKNS